MKLLCAALVAVAAFGAAQCGEVTGATQADPFFMPGTTLKRSTALAIDAKSYSTAACNADSACAGKQTFFFF